MVYKFNNSGVSHNQVKVMEFRAKHLVFTYYYYNLFVQLMDIWLFYIEKEHNAWYFKA